MQKKDGSEGDPEVAQGLGRAVEAILSSPLLRKFCFSYSSVATVVWILMPMMADVEDGDESRLSLAFMVMATQTRDLLIQLSFGQTVAF